MARQVLATALAIGYFTFLASGVTGPAAIVIGNGLALSSTAVVLQVCYFLVYSSWSESHELLIST